MGTWSLVWVAVGVLCIGTAPWHRTLTAAIAVGAGVGMHLLWGLSFLWATIHGDSPRGWVSSVSYIMIVALVSWSVWRGSRTEIRVREERHE
jgi:ABC-type nickel/cobalt efflux system permease component RcnA